MAKHLPFIAAGLYLLAGGLVTAGVAAVYPPAGLAAGGALLAVWTRFTGLDER